MYHVGHMREAARTANTRTRERWLKNEGDKSSNKEEMADTQSNTRTEPWNKINRLKAANSSYNNGRKEKVDTQKKHRASERIN